MNLRIAFIINPISGVVKKDKIINQIKSRLSSKFDYAVAFTRRPGHATDLCRDFVQQGMNIVVAVGGDGSVNEVAKGLVHTDTALGIIPGGSGNGLAHHLSIPVNFEKAIDIINSANIIKIDTGTINDELFASIAGIGFDGVVARKFSETKRRGFLSYLKIVTETYPTYKPKHYKIIFNDQQIKTQALFITFANSNQFGYNTAIAPEARVDDGLLDVCIAKKPPIIELPYLASLLYWRKIDQSKYLEIYQANKLKVITKKNRWVNIDGEARKLGKKLNIRIHPQSLKIVIP
ncbi:MAG: diacylglycerol kinase family protein [Bacteroidota bacterium]|nr:diacylglycerol kinase family protein [Bacteroidota bacterium]